MPIIKDEDLWGDDSEINIGTIRLTRPVKTKVKKIGDSRGFIISKKIVEYLGLEVGDECNVWIEKRQVKK